MEATRPPWILSMPVVAVACLETAMHLPAEAGGESVSSEIDIPSLFHKDLVCGAGASSMERGYVYTGRDYADELRTPHLALEAAFRHYA